MSKSQHRNLIGLSPPDVFHAKHGLHRGPFTRVAICCPAICFLAIIAMLDCDPYINIWLRRVHSGHGHHYIDTTSQHPAPGGGARWDHWKNLPSESREGTLRLVRRGKTVYYLFADGDSTQFRLRRQQELSDAPVKMDGLRLLTQTSGIGSTRVVWKKVVVRADDIDRKQAE